MAQLTLRTVALSTGVFVLTAALVGGVRWVTLPPPLPVVEGEGALAVAPLAPALDSMAHGDSVVVDSALNPDSLTAIINRLRSDSAARALLGAADSAPTPTPAPVVFPRTAADSGLLRLLDASDATTAAELLLSLDDARVAKALLALPGRKAAAILQALAPEQRVIIVRLMANLPPLPPSDDVN